MVAIDDDSLKPMLVDHALELRHRGRRIADRQRRQAEEPRRMAPDGFCERGVRLAREGLRLVDLELFDARRRQRQRLHIDAGRIHRRDAAIADVEEVGDKLREPAADLFGALLQPAVGAVEEGGRSEVFFDRNRAQGMSRCLLKFSKRSLRIEIYAASAI